MIEFASQLAALKNWFSSPSPRQRILRQELHDLTAVVEVAYNKKSNTFTAAYSVKTDRFDQIVHGKKVRGGGILTVQCGFVAPPLHQVVGYPERPETLARLMETTASESGVFFSALSDLEHVYDELGARVPQFPFADPRAPSHRKLFRAVIAALLGKAWQQELQCAFDQLLPGVSRDWFNDVRKRLGQFELERNKNGRSIT